MKQIISTIFLLTTLVVATKPALAVSTGSKVEYIPASRKLGIGVINPATNVEVNGQVLIRGGDPAPGKILTTDANGLASWETATVLGSDIIGDVANTENASTMNNGTIINSTFTDGTIDGARLINVVIDPDSHQHSSLTNPNDSTTVVQVNSSSKVGIGTNNPSERLAVNGNLKANNFIGDGSSLTGISASNVANANTASTANFANFALTTTTNLSGGTIHNATITNTDLAGQITGGTFNGTKLVNITYKDPHDPWILVYSEDFEVDPTGWSNNTRSGCAGHNILGGFNIAGKGASLEKTFDLSAYPHSHVRIDFNYYSLDSWDTRYVPELNIFLKETALAKIDNSIVWSKPYIDVGDEGREAFPNCGVGALSGGPDAIFQGSAKAKHSRDHVKVSFTSTLDQTPEDESFGIDNLEIWVKRAEATVTPEPPPLTPEVLSTCLTLRQAGNVMDGIYTLDTDGTGPQAPFQAYCDMNTQGGGWMLVKRLVPGTTDTVGTWTDRIQEITYDQGNIGASDVVGVDEYTLARSKWNNFGTYMLRRYTTSDGKSKALTFNSSNFEFSSSGVYSGSGSPWISLPGMKIDGESVTGKYANIPSGGHIQSGSCQYGYATLGTPTPTGELAFCDTDGSGAVVYNSVNSFWGSPFATHYGTSTSDPARMVINTPNDASWNPNLGLLIYIREGEL